MFSIINKIFPIFVYPDYTTLFKYFTSPRLEKLLCQELEAQYLRGSSEYRRRYIFRNSKYIEVYIKRYIISNRYIYNNYNDSMHKIMTYVKRNTYLIILNEQI